jgi:hypothetical protein
VFKHKRQLSFSKYDIDLKAVSKFLKWSRYAVRTERVDPTLIPFNHEVSFFSMVTSKSVNNISFQSTKWYYMVISLACGVLRVQLRLLGTLFSENITSHRYVTYSDSTC